MKLIKFIKFKLIDYIIFSLIFIIIGSCAYPLNIGEKQIRNFEKEAIKFIKWLINQDIVRENDKVSISISNKKYNQVNFDFLTVVFEYLPNELENLIRSDNFSLDQFSKLNKISINAKFSESSIQEIIIFEIDRVKPDKRIFDKVIITLLDEKFKLSGYIIIKNSPISLLAQLFKSQYSIYFDVTLSLKINNDTIEVDILEGTINNQQITDELKQQFLNWLNPIWDFSKMPINTKIARYNISNKMFEFDVSFNSK